MKIGFDAKRVFFNNTGLGNYSRDSVRVLSKYFPKNNANKMKKDGNKNWKIGGLPPHFRRTPRGVIVLVPSDC